MASSQTFPTVVHPFESPTPHARAYETGLKDAKNALVFIGGLGDGPHTVPYPRAIGKHLESFPELSYSVFEFTMRSSFLGFGFSRLANDVEDISALVRYLKSIGKQRVVLIGHSTGCQVHKLPPVKFAYSLPFSNKAFPFSSLKAADKYRTSWNTPPRHTRT